VRGGQSGTERGNKEEAIGGADGRAVNALLPYQTKNIAFCELIVSHELDIDWEEERARFYSLEFVCQFQTHYDRN
jgi:hypothetical protein